MEDFKIGRALGFSHNASKNVAKAEIMEILHYPPSKDGGK
jgi:hypothetical protein